MVLLVIISTITLYKKIDHIQLALSKTLRKMTIC